jgi:hypothetical protein
MAYAEDPAAVCDLCLTLPLPARDEVLLTAGLTFLALENVRDANKLLVTFKLAVTTDDSHPGPTRPALLLAWLLEVTRHDAPQAYKWLVTYFRAELDGNEQWKSMAGAVGKKMFSIAPPPNMLNML